MGATFIDLSAPRHSDLDLPSLENHLAVLVGEPFRLIRVSYGDELTIHFGDLHPAKSPKLQGKVYASYILGLRSSAWLLKSGTLTGLLAAGLSLHDVPEAGKKLSSAELEDGEFIKAGARVVTIQPFPIPSSDSIGLKLKFTDGSGFFVIPTDVEAEERRPDVPEDVELPEIANWELRTPYGDLQSGPGMRWDYQPRISDG